MLYVLATHVVVITGTCAHALIFHHVINVGGYRFLTDLLVPSIDTIFYAPRNGTASESSRYP